MADEPITTTPTSGSPQEGAVINDPALEPHSLSDANVPATPNTTPGSSSNDPAKDLAPVVPDPQNGAQQRVAQIAHSEIVAKRGGKKTHRVTNHPEADTIWAGGEAYTRGDEFNGDDTLEPDVLAQYEHRGFIVRI